MQRMAWTYRSYAHASDGNLLLLSPQLRQRGHDLTCTCATQRMPERDGAAARVYFRQVQLQFLRTVDTLNTPGVRLSGVVIARKEDARRCLPLMQRLR